MGRDLVEMKRGWCFRETVSEANARTSRFFGTKEEALGCLEENGYHPQLIELLRDDDHVPSMVGGIMSGLELDRCLRRAEKQRGGKVGEFMDMMQKKIEAFMDSIHESEE